MLQMITYQGADSQYFPSCGPIGPITVQAVDQSDQSQARTPQASKTTVEPAEVAPGAEVHGTVMIPLSSG